MMRKIMHTWASTSGSGSGFLGIGGTNMLQNPRDFPICLKKDTYMCTIYIELTRKLHLPKTEESNSWHCMKKEKNKHSYLLLLSTFTLSFFLLFPSINLSSSPTGVMVWSLLTPCMSLIEAPLASKYSVSQKSNMWLEVCIRIKQDNNELQHKEMRKLSITHITPLIWKKEKKIWMHLKCHGKKQTTISMHTTKLVPNFHQDF